MENSKLSAESGLQRLQLLECMTPCTKLRCRSEILLGCFLPTSSFFYYLLSWSAGSCVDAVNTSTQVGRREGLSVHTTEGLFTQQRASSHNRGQVHTTGGSHIQREVPNKGGLQKNSSKSLLKGPFIFLQTSLTYL